MESGVGVDGDDDAAATIDPRLLVAVPFVNSDIRELRENFEQELDLGETGLAGETLEENDFANSHS